MSLKSQLESALAKINALEKEMSAARPKTIKFNKDSVSHPQPKEIEQDDSDLFGDDWQGLRLHAKSTTNTTRTSRETPTAVHRHPTPNDRLEDAALLDHLRLTGNAVRQVNGATHKGPR